MYKQLTLWPKLQAMCRAEPGWAVGLLVCWPGVVCFWHLSQLPLTASACCLPTFHYQSRVCH